MGYYHKLETLQDDLTQLVERVTRTRCRNQLAKDYLAKVLQSGLLHLDRKKTEFVSKWRSYMEGKFRDNEDNPRVLYEWSKFAGAKRQYFTIDDYRVTTGQDMLKLPENLNQATINNLEVNTECAEFQEVVTKMKSNKKSRCAADCPCQDSTVDLKLKLSQSDTIMAASQEPAALQKKTPGQEAADKELCCFHRKVECGAECGCDPTTCRNR